MELTSRKLLGNNVSFGLFGEMEYSFYFSFYLVLNTYNFYPIIVDIYESY